MRLAFERRVPATATAGAMGTTGRVASILNVSFEGSLRHNSM